MMKMVLTDLDHTLLREDGTVSEETLRIISRCRAKGMLLAVATSRYWIGAERYIRLLDPDYEITTDGTLLHARGHCIWSRAISQADTNRIIRHILSLFPEAEITAAHGKDVYWNSRHIARSKKLYKAIYCDFASPLPFGANKIAAGLPDESIARRIADEADCGLQCYRGENWYAFLPKGAGKASAVRALAEASSVRLEDTVAFGDDASDLGMLKLCGKGIAVANAVPEVVSAADDVTLSNEMDGPALWLNCRCLYRSLLSSTFNTRDLGGHQLPSGRMTVRNRIWRSDAPTVRNETDLALLKSLGLLTVIDLRTDPEAAGKPCVCSAEEGFAYRRIPLVIGSTPPDTFEEVPLTYLEMAGQAETADVLRTAAEAKSGVLYCCTAGKDRTGVISALLLLACGADRETIVEDYVLSREYNRLRLERYLSEHPNVDRRIVLASEAGMQRFLDLFLERYGSIEAYFGRMGLSSGHLTLIRGKLLDAVP